jgi:peptide/nickel transport system permease protein
MQAYIARRLIFGVFSAILVTLIIFFVMRVAPGDVATMIASEQVEEGQEINQELVERVRKELGLDKPIVVQYFIWVWDMVRLDWGESLFVQRSVFGDFTKKVPISIELALTSLIFSTLMGIPIGIMMALKQDTLWDYALRIFTLGGISVPNFWIATMLIVGGMYYMNWSPRLSYTHIWDDPWNNINMFFWPALIGSYATMATKARMMRSTMLEVLRQDYIRTAHAKGLRPFVVTFKHAMKNALLPVVTIIGLTVVRLLGGQVITERVFNLPGIGNMLVEGMRFRDYPVVQVLTFIFATWTIMVNLVTDLTYGILDPRVRFD